MNAKAKGTRKEHQTRDLFKAAGWEVIRPGASLGAADLLCLKAGECPLAIQVKCNAGSPYMNFRGPERTELLEWSKRSGCVPLLAHWRPRARSHDLLEAWEWP